MHIVIVFFCLFFSMSVCAESVAPIRFSPIPMLPKDQSIRKFYPVTNYLTKHLHYPVTLELRSFYDDIIIDFMDGKIDLAFLGPLPFAILKEQYPDSIPLVTFLNKSGGSTYTCSLIRFAEDDPSNTEITLTQPYSTCGYLMTEMLLRKQNRSIKALTHYYIGNHRDAALAVIKGQTRFAGLKTSIAKQFEHMGVQIIDSTEPLPGFLLVANGRTLSPDRIEQIKTAMLRLDPANSIHQSIMESWNSILQNGSIPADESAYAPILKRYREINIPGVSR